MWFSFGPCVSVGSAWSYWLSVMIDVLHILWKVGVSRSHCNSQRRLTVPGFELGLQIFSLTAEQTMHRQPPPAIVIVGIVSRKTKLALLLYPSVWPSGFSFCLVFVCFSSVFHFSPVVSLRGTGTAGLLIYLWKAARSRREPVLCLSLAWHLLSEL